MKINLINIFLLLISCLAFDCTRVVAVSPHQSKTDRPLDNDAHSITGGDLTSHDRGSSDGPSRDVSLGDGGLNDRGLHDLGQRDLGQRDLGLRDVGVTVPGTWASIPAGKFYMGSPAGEACRYTYETQHVVMLTHAFEIQTTEVTREQYSSLRGYQPSKFSCANCPVEQVDWHEAAAYCNALSALKGYTACYNCTGTLSNVTCVTNSSFASANFYLCPGYRLPTEAEWEYAYRAGTSASLYNNTEVVNCSTNDVNSNLISWNFYNASSTTHAVGGKPANDWGLYDMAGNVWEWCNDFWDFSTDYGSAFVTDPWGMSSAIYRVQRGGSWGYFKSTVRAALRQYDPPTTADQDVGFRCVRTQ